MRLTQLLQTYARAAFFLLDPDFSSSGRTAGARLTASALASRRISRKCRLICMGRVAGAEKAGEPSLVICHIWRVTAQNRGYKGPPPLPPFSPGGGGPSRFRGPGRSTSPMPWFWDLITPRPPSPASPASPLSPPGRRRPSPVSPAPSSSAAMAPFHAGAADSEPNPFQVPVAATAAAVALEARRSAAAIKERNEADLASTLVHA